jgi:diguanylate cyclase (GGDEF)-like protein
MASPAGLINLNRFLPFMDAVIEAPSMLGLFDAAGRILQASPGLSGDAHAVLKARLAERPLNWAGFSGKRQVVQLSADDLLLIEVVELGAMQQTFWLAALLKAVDCMGQPDKLTSLQKILQAMAECLAEDYLTQLSLSGMAEELGIRYEELNLLYGLQEVNSFFSNTNEQDALNLLLDNCTDYLRVALVALLLVEQDSIIQHVRSSENGFDLDLLQQTLKGPLLRWMQTNRHALVQNSTIRLGSSEVVQIPYKFIAIPLFKASGNLAAILLLVNWLDAPDFTNNDRRLAEVMAAEAAKLMRERRDPLTDLLNRKGFYEKMELAVEQVKKTGKAYWLIFLDLDQFKTVNDNAGQQAGDALLKQTAALIKKQLANHDVIARFGADEFAVLLQASSFAEVQQKAQSICQLIHQFRFVYQNKLYDIAISIGIVWVDPTVETISELLGAADLACRVAKERGGNGIHVYQASDQHLLTHEDPMQWIGRINKALEQERFVLYRQLIQPLSDGPDEEHYELLIRLIDENGAIISPVTFIPAAERYGLMSKLDRWVIKTALAKMAARYNQSPDCQLGCSINLSGQSFCEQGFQDYLIEQVVNSGLPADRICFEMTETVAVSNLSQAIDFMKAVKQIGCKFALDDFGSGMSSFTYLKNLPVDYLKIDGYFVRTILENKVDRVMVESINQIGQVMGLKTIAEFVENDAILVELKAIGVDYVQGYALGKPELF